MSNRNLMLFRIVTLLVVLGTAAFAQTGMQSAPAGSTLNPGGIYCLPAENLLNFSSLNVFAGAADQASGNPATVKWLVFAGPASNNPGVDRLFKQDAQSISTSVPKDTNPSNVWTQACINNNSGATVVFFLQQTPQ